MGHLFLYHVQLTCQEGRILSEPKSLMIKVIVISYIKYIAAAEALGNISFYQTHTHSLGNALLSGVALRLRDRTCVILPVICMTNFNWNTSEMTALLSRHDVELWQCCNNSMYDVTMWRTMEWPTCKRRYWRHKALVINMKHVQNRHMDNFVQDWTVISF